MSKKKKSKQKHRLFAETVIYHEEGGKYQKQCYEKQINQTGQEMGINNGN